MDIRVKVRRRPARRPCLLLAVHHLVVDGVSWRILLEDLGTAYAQEASGDPAGLGPTKASITRWWM